MNRLPRSPVRSAALKRKAPQRGLTLIEALMALAVSGVALGTALPSFEKARERRQLDAVAAQLATDIQFTRGEAVMRNAALRLSFGHGPAGSCYVVHSGSAGQCDCMSAIRAVCSGGAQVVRHAWLPDSHSPQVRANVGSMVFHPVMGTSTPTGTLRVIGRGDQVIHHVVNLMGRVRSCSPGGSVSGYVPC